MATHQLSYPPSSVASPVASSAASPAASIGERMEGTVHVPMWPGLWLVLMLGRDSPCCAKVATCAFASPHTNCAWAAEADCARTRRGIRLLWQPNGHQASDPVPVRSPNSVALAWRTGTDECSARWCTRSTILIIEDSATIKAGPVCTSTSANAASCSAVVTASSDDAAVKAWQAHATGSWLLHSIVLCHAALLGSRPNTSRDSGQLHVCSDACIGIPRRHLEP